MYIRLKTGEVYYTSNVKITGNGYIRFNEDDHAEKNMNIHIDMLWDINKNNPNA